VRPENLPHRGQPLLAFLEKTMESRVAAKISRMVQHAITANIARSHRKKDPAYLHVFVTSI
jgi:hypothetical protein